MKNRFLLYAWLVVFASLWQNGCKHPDNPEPNLPPMPFTVKASLSPSGSDVVLTWTRVHDPNGDPVTFSVVYTDTLARNLADTTFTIHNVGYSTIISGKVIAKDNYNASTAAMFSISIGNQPFTATAKGVLGMADLKPHNIVNDVLLSWTKLLPVKGDSVRYTIVYKDTLATNLTDTTFTIPNVGNNAIVTGIVLAKTTKGLLSSSPFRILSGIPPRVRIKKWIRTSTALRYYNYTTFSYDSLGRLASFNTQEGKVCCFTRGQTSVLHYDQVGRLISLEGLQNGDNTGQFEMYLHTFDYNERGNLSVEKVYYTTYQKLPLEYRREVHYEYNGANLLIKTVSGNETVSFPSYYIYKNGNIVQQDRFDSNGNKLAPILYQYSSAPNPFYGLWGYDEVSSPEVTFSRNYESGNKVTVIYDSSGLMLKRYDQSTIDRQEEFEYETY